ncbi:hypothetical protein CU103_19535 [Phyllobacterium sophorae]|uniref:Uncharacterized protein n=1 Tax=Phyllobacterium sophorae TaxID=1520277 RepID=A0A2P7B6L3_9HYPH|nr:hypothetical protein CU103_19535 [Phyllobacterium sophorae]
MSADAINDCCIALELCQRTWLVGFLLPGSKKVSTPILHLFGRVEKRQEPMGLQTFPLKQPLNATVLALPVGLPSRLKSSPRPSCKPIDRGCGRRTPSPVDPDRFG